MSANALLVILGIGFILAGVGVTIFRSMEMRDKKFVPQNIICLVLGVAFLLGNGFFTIIPTGYTGVKTTFGQIDNVVMQNGINGKTPIIQKINLVNNKQQDVAFDDQEIWSETSERTALAYSKITVTYQINPEKSAWIYANVANYKDNLVTQPIVSSAVKSASKTLHDTDATNRTIVEPLVRDNVQASLDEKFGESTVLIKKVVIGNIDFEESYNQAIAEKQAEQLAYEKQQIENKKAVEKAQADASVAEINANAEKKKTEIAAEAQATAITTEAKATAEANNMINDSVTDKVIAYMQADKWDGARSRVVVGSDSGQVIIDAGAESVE